MIHRNLLSYRGARYLWWSLGLIVAFIALAVVFLVSELRR